MPNITATLPSSSAAALIKIAGMFGSNYPGERAAAAALADKLVRGAGLCWEDVISAQRAEQHRGHADDWRGMVYTAALRAEMLDERERAFLDSLSRWRGNPTEKQFSWLAAIYSRVTRGA